MSRLTDLIEAAAAAAVDHKRTGVIAERLTAAAKAEAERARLAGNAGDRYTTQAGVLRCDGLTKGVAPFVEDDAAFASYVAERMPGSVTATITVPAEVLATVLDAVDATGVPWSSSVRVLNQDAALRDLVVEVHPDADSPSGWVAVGADGLPVPGVTGRRPGLRWVLTPAKDAVKAAEAEAKEYAEDAVHALTDEPETAPTDLHEKFAGIPTATLDVDVPPAA